MPCCVAGGSVTKLKQLEAQLVRLEDRAHRVISPAARDNFVAASCVLLNEHDKAIGVGFFIAGRICLTRNDCLLACCQEGQQVTAAQPSGERFVLTVSQRNLDLNYATLRSEQQHIFVTCYRGAPAELVGKDIALCAFHISLEEEFDEDYPIDLSVMRVRNHGTPLACL